MDEGRVGIGEDPKVVGSGGPAHEEAGQADGQGPGVGRRVTIRVGTPPGRRGVARDVLPCLFRERFREHPALE
jgi:hypothetical protein